MLVILYDRWYEPLDAVVVVHDGVVPPGLARRVAGEVGSGVQELTTLSGDSYPSTKLEIRILHFELVD